MFDLGFPEIILIVIVAVIVIGPSELPRAMATAGRWIGKARRTMTHFRTGLDAMVREAELEEMEKKWAVENERIMREHPADDALSGDGAMSEVATEASKVKQVEKEPAAPPKPKARPGRAYPGGQADLPLPENKPAVREPRETTDKPS